jgi:hypothetical protein
MVAQPSLFERLPDIEGNPHSVRLDPRVELKPCPFCGCDSDEIDMYEYDDGTLQFTCHCGGMLYFGTDSPERMIEVWNTRTKPGKPCPVTKERT